MTPEEQARVVIDKKLEQSGWTIQDMKKLNLTASLGVAVREFPTSTGPVDYALFVDGSPVGVVEAKKSAAGENITAVEGQSARYAHSTFKWVQQDYRIRFAYEATDKLVRFTDYDDIKYRSRSVFSFHRPETLKALLNAPNTVRNNMKNFPPLDEKGFRKCQIKAINNLDISFADNRPKALVQMATGAGKTFTAITAAYRLLKYGRMNRILFLVDTKSLGEQAEREFLAYTPNDDPRNFSQLYGVRRLKNSYIPNDIQICISTIQLGATVDYAILMTTRYKAERIGGKEKKAAVHTALATSIPSIIVSGMGMFAATFGVALYSDIEIVSSMCMLIARGAVVSMLLVIFILPAMFMLLDKVICKTTAGMTHIK